ncbi:Glycosyl transferase family 2 [Virgibacillus subterraneus]|uniref:Glycosyl transferase family 2 n=1 Tax=Virgibacillus subterraneus TaxID=621109 RepID=A0A1H8ZSJ2_9BACI|nr:glycosyltransferase [Virgibacillus subterraneus]SEP67450.1 Glycosyl transferase family 2 [Virgibacillus subterraneus]
MNPQISIIVPIYNVEQYLHKCMGSILAQTFKNIEVILVNDGSTDKSSAICDLYENMDNRIEVIHKKNGGVSSARNKGIEAAKGEFIAFVDPDDVIEPTMYEELWKSAKQLDADIVVCPIKTINQVINRISISSIWNKSGCVLNKQIIENEIIPSILVNKTYSLVSSVNKLYKKTIFDFYGIRFDEKKHHSEDARLNFTLLMIIDTLVFVDKPLYIYYIRERGSLTQVFRPNLFEYIKDNRTFLVKLCEKYNMNEKIKFVTSHFTNVTLLHIQDVVLNANLTKVDKQKILLSIMEDEVFMNDILSYSSPSFFYQVLKVLSIRKKIKLLISIVRIKIGVQNIHNFIMGFRSNID